VVGLLSVALGRAARGVKSLLVREHAAEPCETVHADGQSAGEEEPVPRLEAIVINCREPAALASFYAELLGLAVSPEDAAAITAGTLGEDESVLLGSRDSLHVWLTPVGDQPPVPGRVHLDVRLDSGEDLGQLTALGATWQWDDLRGRWTVFADPEGNLFCAIPPAV
jgi:catechol-2,3-dioxygenase